MTVFYTGVEKYKNLSNKKSNVKYKHSQSV